MAATGWTKSSLDTYWSKQFRGFMEELPNGRYRVKEGFRPYLDWRKFRSLATQVKTASTDYRPAPPFESVVIYEFYMPLAHESALKTTLDSLFYKDAILPRLKRTGKAKLVSHGFQDIPGQSDDNFYARVLKLVDEKFGGYSIYHVDGRFRAGGLKTFDEAVELQKASQRYLVDETTAVTRFIFPCSDVDEAKRVRFLFQELFVIAITQLISGEDEIWAVESGMENRVHVWKRED